MINASTFDVNNGALRGTNIQYGKKYSNDGSTFNRTYLTIEKDNRTLSYSVTEPSIENVNVSLLGFFPIIIDGKNVINEFGADYPHKGMPNPQQVIYQYENGTIGVLTVEGRIGSQRGMTIEECTALLIDKGVNFAYLLDGGGSSTLTINGRTINRVSGGSEREVKDFLCIDA